MRLYGRRGLMAAIGAGTVVAGVGSVARAAETTFTTARQTKRLVVGIANEKPYGYVGTDGKPTGAIPDVIRAALQPYGITEIDAKVVDFNALIPGINARRFDIIGAGMYIKPARCRAIAFSNPVTRSGGAFITKRGNPRGVHSLKDVAAEPDVKLGTQTGSRKLNRLGLHGIRRFCSQRTTKRWPDYRPGAWTRSISPTWRSTHCCNWRRTPAWSGLRHSNRLSGRTGSRYGITRRSVSAPVTRIWWPR
jgi:hypothetical protein